MVRIAWSGLAGHTGREAVKAMRSPGSNVRITTGISRADRTLEPDFTAWEFQGIKWCRYGNLCANLDRFEGVDLLVDFSLPGCFDEVLDLAIRLKVPLISGTANLFQRQLNRFDGLASATIPIYRGGNFLFGMHRFTDKVVSFAQTQEELPVLEEEFFQGKALPSEASKNICKLIEMTTGKVITVHSEYKYPRESRICDWRFGDLHYRTEGFAELAQNVLRIAEVMVNKEPLGIPYDLNMIWDDLLALEAADAQA